MSPTVPTPESAFRRPVDGVAPAEEAVSQRPVSPARRALLTFGVATMIALVLASQTLLAWASFGRSISWTGALVNLLRETWLWALFVPAVFAFTRRFPLRRECWARALAAHVALGALVFCLAHSLGNTAIVEWLTPEHLHPANVFGSRKPPPPAPPPPAISGQDTGTTARGESRGEARGRHGPGGPPLSQRFWFGFVSRLQSNLFSYALIVAIWHWLDHERRLRDRERQSRELSRQLAEARLQALRMQLNPHFLFNTLNAIATLVHRDPHAADEMIGSLSDFLRLTLTSQHQPESPLRTELEFARRYLDIEKVRFGERLVVTESIEPDCLSVAVPTLVLQPLLENAIRHGIERSEFQGRLELSARHDADHRELVLRIGNTGPAPATPKASPQPHPSSRSGVGIANTRARLQEIHGARASLHLAPRAEGGYDAVIRIPWPSPAA